MARMGCIFSPPVTVLSVNFLSGARNCDPEIYSPNPIIALCLCQTKSNLQASHFQYDRGRSGTLCCLRVCVVILNLSQIEVRTQIEIEIYFINCQVTQMFT